MAERTRDEEIALMLEEAIRIRQREYLSLRVADAKKENPNAIRISEEARSVIFSEDAPSFRTIIVPVTEEERMMSEVSKRDLDRLFEAVQRHKDGTYGNCFECGEEIDLPRLRALPFAVRCKRCDDGRDLLAQAHRVSEVEKFELKAGAKTRRRSK